VRVLQQVRTRLERQCVGGMLVITHARTLPRRGARGKRKVKTRCVSSTGLTFICCYFNLSSALQA
jgi:hypothetical protein